MTSIEQVLELARWAPSGDNTQPWRFRIEAPDRAVVNAFDTRTHCVYDLHGEASQLSVGAMLETARIAATQLGCTVEITRDSKAPEEQPRFDLRLHPQPGLEADPLISVITTRCTNRKPYKTQPLSAEHKKALEQAVGERYELRWLEQQEKRAAARLMFRSAAIRLTIPEAYEVHAAVIEWHARFSETKLPDQALGMDPAGLALMRWAMGSWPRMRILSHYLGGTLMPRIQLDLVPGLCSGAYAVILARTEPRGIDDRLAAGGAVQRFWLTAAALGLQHQPCVTPLIFARYHRLGTQFSGDRKALSKAAEVAAEIDKLLGPAGAQRAVWMGRLGYGRLPESRSLRRPLAALTGGD